MRGLPLGVDSGSPRRGLASSQHRFSGVGEVASQSPCARPAQSVAEEAASLSGIPGPCQPQGTPGPQTLPLSWVMRLAGTSIQGQPGGLARSGALSPAG